jgi:hypothetical protein
MTGINIGSASGTQFGYKHAIWKLASGGHCEGWVDKGTGWARVIAADRPCGQTYSPVSSQSINFRTDASGVNWTGGRVLQINANPTQLPPGSVQPGTPGSGETGSPGPDPNEGYPILILDSSGNDGNLESNLIDGNLSTRWSDNGLGAFISLDLQQLVPVNEVDINWYNGDQRSNNFSIATSPDNVTWTNVFSGTSSPSTATQSYTFPQVNAKYVKVTVNGNTQNNWASINSIAVNGPGAQGTGAAPPPSNAAYNEFETIFNEDFYDVGLCQPV